MARHYYIAIVSLTLVLGACTGSGPVDEVLVPAEDADAMAPSDGAIDDTTDAVDPGLGCGTFSDNDCSPGTYCAGPAVCGATWTCQEEHPCSAAPPFLACGCDGRIAYVAAGCTERHAWRFGGLPEQFGDMPIEGDPCDASARNPLTLDVVLRGSGFDPGTAAVTAWITGDTTPHPVALQPDGTFELRVDGVVHDGGSMSIALFLDVDGDAACRETSGDRYGYVAAQQFDTVALVVTTDVTPGNLLEWSCEQLP